MPLETFQNGCETAGLARSVVVVGYLDSADDTADRLGRPRHSPQNAAAVIPRGEVTARYAKHHLPNYGVFDEYRYFVPGDSPCTFKVGGHTVALAICEDLWQYGGPIAWAKDATPTLVLVINGSPYERNKDDVRLELCSRAIGGSRERAGLRQPGRRAGRAGVRRRLARRRRLRVTSSRELHSSTKTC